MPVRPPVEPAWWTSGSIDGVAMRDALAGRDIGAVFRFLHQRGWSWASIAQATDIGEQRVREIANGKRRVENYDVYVRVAVGLNIPRDYLGVGLSPAGGDGQLTSAAPAPDPASQDWFAILRRGGRRGSGMPEGGRGPVVSGWIYGELSDSPEAFRPARPELRPAQLPLSETDVSVVRGMLASLTAADHQFGGGFARRTAGSFLTEVVQPRLAAPGPASVLRSFRAAAAEFQVRIAWMHLDVADHAGARAAAREAFRLAQESEDLAVCSWAMAMNALLETWLGSTVTARAYGQAAVGLAADGPSLVRAFAQGKLARALAAAGDSDGALESLSQARSLFDVARPSEDERVPEPVRDGYSGAYVLDEEAHCFRDIGRDKMALARSEECLGLRGEDRFPRNRAFATGNRALSLARLGEVDQACDSALSLLQLATVLQSSRVVGRLDAVLEELASFRTAPLVTDLTERVKLAGITRLRT